MISNTSSGRKSNKSGATFSVFPVFASFVILGNFEGDDGGEIESLWARFIRGKGAKAEVGRELGKQVRNLWLPPRGVILLTLRLAKLI
jgi:hypothetical protein